MIDNVRMTSRRQCGECTACCEGWLRSKVIDMEPGRPCQHCTGQGCAIYPDRPDDPCRSFECGWLKEGSPMPEELRPDRCGAIVVFNRYWGRWPIVVAIPVGPEIPADTLEWLKAYARDNGVPLLFDQRVMQDGKYVGIKELGYGPPAFVEAVRDGIGPQDIFQP